MEFVHNIFGIGVDLSPISIILIAILVLWAALTSAFFGGLLADFFSIKLKTRK